MKYCFIELNNNLNTNFEIINAEITEKTNYSSDEMIVGTWINGKSLYRKVLKFDKMAGTSIIFNHNIDNVDVMIVDSKSYVIPISSEIPDGCNYPANCNYCILQPQNHTQLRFRESYGVTLCNIVAVLEYTKTTD